MTRAVRQRLAVASSAARAGLGGLQLLAPTLVARLGNDQHIDTATRRVIRVLGVRQLAQAALEISVQRPGVVRMGQVVDALHGVSMVMLWREGSDPAHSRLARTDAVFASLFVLSGSLVLGSHREVLDPRRLLSRPE